MQAKTKEQEPVKEIWKSDVVVQTASEAKLRLIISHPGGECDPADLNGLPCPSTRKRR